MCTSCGGVIGNNGLFCRAGRHWVHYRCENLSEMEVKRSADPGFICRCKQCLVKDENTLVKTVVSPKKHSPNEVLQVPSLIQPSLAFFRYC